MPNSGIPAGIKAHLRQAAQSGGKQQQAYQPHSGATFFQNNQGVNSYSQLPAIGSGSQGPSGTSSGNINGAGYGNKSGQDLTKEMMQSAHLLAMDK